MKAVMDQEKDQNKDQNKDHKKKSILDRIKNPILREIAEWAEMLVVAALIALFINNVIIANSVVPTGSMETTINAGDRVVGLRLLYTFGQPKRGDIAIFRLGWKCRHCGEQGELAGDGPGLETCPACGKSLRFYQTVYYVKRVIGEPGDRIEIRAEGSCKAGEIVSDARKALPEDDQDLSMVTAAVYVNGEKIDEPYLREPMLYSGDMEFEVPENCYFMMGDNRNCSLDARYWDDSYITKKKMIAKVLFRYWRKPSLLK